MYDTNDTIVAVSSPSPGARAIIRMTGPATIDTCQRIFHPPIRIRRNGILPGTVAVDDELQVDALLYLFFAPYSYAGEDVAEIHIHTSAAVAQTLVDNLLAKGLRAAGPGEFTARAYLAGKIDLAQAEAVNEVVVSSNRYQLAAAERLLSGRLADATAEVRSAMTDCLSLIEAGIDFSQEDIELVTRAETVGKLRDVKARLEQLLSGSINYEAVIDLPAVGIAGAPNAGKSSLLNKLLGKARSIVSGQRKTTRDVLTGVLTLEHCRCVLFDCAGLTGAAGDGGPLLRQGQPWPPASGGTSDELILDELAQQAALEALRNSSVVVFCVDVSKADWAEDICVRGLIALKTLVPVATKCDLLSDEKLADCLVRLNVLFGTEFLTVSAKTGVGLERLQAAVDRALISPFVPGYRASTIDERAPSVALIARHRQAVTEALGAVDESIQELNAGNDEVAAMLLRAAYRCVGDIQQQPVDEQVLQKIFSRFCVGK
jgi:tRNA modification GTPase